MPLTYSAILLILFVLLLVCEFFVPSAGMVGLVAVVCGIASIIIAFTHSLFAGMSVIAVIGVATPSIVIAMIRYWPHTPIGRVILNRRPGQTDDPVESTLKSGEKRKDLIGKLGVAHTDLLPSGLVMIDGKRLDAVSGGAAIDAGTEIVVTNIVAGKIQVRKAGRSDLSPEQVEIEQKTQSIENSLESLNFDSFDED